MSETPEAGQPTPQVEASTGLPEGQVGPVLKTGLIAEARRALGRLFTSKARDDDPKTGWGE